MQREEAKAIISKLIERFAEHREDYHLSIEHSEEKINQLVYELYELTPEEIKII